MSTQSTQDKWIIGIDGGGTKTKLVLQKTSADGSAEYVGPGCNPTYCGMERTQAVLADCLNEAPVPAEQVDAVFAGLAGCFSKERDEQLESFLKDRFPNARVAVRSDIMNVILSEDGPEDCLAAICGTGSVVFAYRAGGLSRFGGWGPEFDLGGNGYSIGKEAIRYALACEDGLEKTTLLSQLVCGRMIGTTPSSVAEIASFAPLVYDAYRQGDPVAQRILAENFSQMARLINGADRSFPEPVRLILAGGLTACPETVSLIRERLDRVTDVRICTDPARGALNGARLLSQGETRWMN